MGWGSVARELYILTTQTLRFHHGGLTLTLIEMYTHYGARQRDTSSRTLPTRAQSITASSTTQGYDKSQICLQIHTFLLSYV